MLEDEPGALTARFWRERGGLVERPDTLIGLALALVMGLATFHVGGLIPSVVLQSVDSWFEADVVYVMTTMTRREAPQPRMQVHPLFPLLTYLPVYLAKQALRIEVTTAVRVVLAGIASVWAVALFIVLRLIGCRRVEAVLFVLLGATSASVLFWFALPQTYSLGALTILFALGLVALATSRSLGDGWYVAVSALTLSATMTNWMAGIVATFALRPWKRALQLTVNAFCLVVVLWGAQKALAPKTSFFLEVAGEGQFAFTPQSDSLLHVARAFLFHAVIMPAVETRPDNAHVAIGQRWAHTGWAMTVQRSAVGSGSMWGRIGTGLWTVLLVFGAYGLVSVKEHRPLRMVVSLTLLGQLILHSVYGAQETFLYSAHFVALLVVLGAFGTLTVARRVLPILVSALIVCAAVNNVGALQRAIRLTQDLSPRYEVYRAMLQRPRDVWPRGTGHVLLATPGTLESEKAYLEPGGSLSPGVGSLGLSLWIIDRRGDPLVTSDTLPLAEIRQRLLPAGALDSLAIATETPYYRARWSVAGVRRWHLSLESDGDDLPVIMIRSVGPAGGPIHRLDWDGRHLLINERWAVAISPSPVAVALNDEGTPAWWRAASSGSHSTHQSGWGCARMELSRRDAGGRRVVAWELDVEDRFRPVAVKPSADESVPRMRIEVPDTRFESSLQAQVAHLRIGLIDQETRAGDPTSYSIAALREGAYVIVALARAGDLVRARGLSRIMAERDFYGGIGAEADSPGLAIWALNEVAWRLVDPDYDRWLWPHIRRKAEWIERMLTTPRPLRVPSVGDVLFTHADRPGIDVVARPSHDGLITPRGDLEWVRLAVNAASYRGLMDAAAFADRRSEAASAVRWRRQATSLQHAWERSFATSGSYPSGRYAASLWPTSVAARSLERLRDSLEVQWARSRDGQGRFRERPKWTYASLAEAHQWLFLNRPDRVWSTLEWFWDHQASPGLYTWWEGDEKLGDASAGWNRVRGWVNGPYVTPHYWTAAEMLLLQQDILAHVDDSSPEPAVVIGGGIPRTWLGRPMMASGFQVPSGTLHWSWDGVRMEVTVEGAPVKVRLGPAFRPGTEIRVRLVPPSPS